MVKVKICGITNLEDARVAVGAEADLLGFILFSKSPRYAPPERVKEIINALKSTRNEFLTVGVFVNETPQRVAEVLDFCGLALAQLHGEEPPRALHQPPLRERAYKALRPRSRAEVHEMAQQYAVSGRMCGDRRFPALLIDAYHPQLRGGTGETGDWELAGALAAHYPLLLAGGLTLDNVAAAIDAVRPWGVDVASGVEAAPGRKNHDAVRAFLAAVKRSEHEPEPRF